MRPWLRLLEWRRDRSCGFFFIGRLTGGQPDSSGRDGSCCDSGDTNADLKIGTRIVIRRVLKSRRPINDVAYVPSLVGGFVDRKAPLHPKSKVDARSSGGAGDAEESRAELVA